MPILMYAYTVELIFFWYNVVCFPRVEYEKNQMRVRYEYKPFV